MVEGEKWGGRRDAEVTGLRPNGDPVEQAVATLEADKAAGSPSLGKAWTRLGWQPGANPLAVGLGVSGALTGCSHSARRRPVGRRTCCS